MKKLKVEIRITIKLINKWSEDDLSEFEEYRYLDSNVFVFHESNFFHQMIQKIRLNNISHDVEYHLSVESGGIADYPAFILMSEVFEVESILNFDNLIFNDDDNGQVLFGRKAKYIVEEVNPNLNWEEISIDSCNFFKAFGEREYNVLEVIRAKEIFKQENKFSIISDGRYLVDDQILNYLKEYGITIIDTYKVDGLLYNMDYPIVLISGALLNTLILKNIDGIPNFCLPVLTSENIDFVK